MITLPDPIETNSTIKQLKKNTEKRHKYTRDTHETATIRITVYLQSVDCLALRMDFYARNVIACLAIPPSEVANNESQMCIHFNSNASRSRSVRISTIVYLVSHLNRNFWLQFC